MGILVLLGTSILIFTIARVVPGDVATIALGSRATEAAKEALRQEMNLHDPLPLQYIKWLGNVLQGDFGNSFITKRAVVMDIEQFLPATLELVIIAGVFIVIGTFGLGLLAGKHKNTWIDGLIRILSYIGVALPAFVVGILLLLLIQGYKLEAIPVLGRLSSSLTPPTNITWILCAGRSAYRTICCSVGCIFTSALPALALAIGPIVQDARALSFFSGR